MKTFGIRMKNLGIRAKNNPGSATLSLNYKFERVGIVVDDPAGSEVYPG
jgi:hypothetical protein